MAVASLTTVPEAARCLVEAGCPVEPLVGKLIALLAATAPPRSRSAVARRGLRSIAPRSGQRVKQRPSLKRDLDAVLTAAEQLRAALSRFAQDHSAAASMVPSLSGFHRSLAKMRSEALTLRVAYGHRITENALLAELVAFVQQHTKKPHDREIAFLLAAFRDVDYAPDSQKKWRKQHAALIKRAVEVETNHALNALIRVADSQRQPPRSMNGES